MIVAIYACMAAAQWCSTHNITIMIERPSPFACMAAQSQLAIWAGTHPAWKIQRWECRSAGIAELLASK